MHFEGVVKGLKIWHIVLAVIAGILLLVLFIFILWKVCQIHFKTYSLLKHIVKTKVGFHQVS